MTANEKIKTINNKMEQDKAHYNQNRETAKTFFFSYNNDVIQKTKINKNACNRALTTIIYVDRGNVSAKNIII